MDKVMVCEHSDRISELMSMALDKQLLAEDRRRLDRHLASCPACQAEWQAMKQVSSLFEQAPMIGPPLGFAVRVERRLSEDVKKRRRAFGGFAVLTSSVSLAGMTIAAIALLIVGVLGWRYIAGLPGMAQSTNAVSKVASGMGLMGKGASLFLMDLLARYGPPVVLIITIGLVLLACIWVWLFLKRPGGSHHNGYA